jgi:chorismate--pyruvate lyase
LKTQPVVRRSVLRQWLSAPGSLSRRLAALGVRFEVQTLHQGPRRLERAEAADLWPHRHTRGWVREVLLRVDGVPLVWARSVAPRGSLNGPWRALRGLASRPLADLLFKDKRVQRTPLRRERLALHGPLASRLAHQWGWANGGAAPPRGMLWARSSVFHRRGAPLRVMEVFAPSLCAVRPTHRLGVGSMDPRAHAR